MVTGRACAARIVRRSDNAATMSTLEAIRYRDGVLEILDQLLLPSQTKYEIVKSVEDAWKVIRTMRVRKNKNLS